MMEKMPEALARTITSVHGEQGEQWLAQFDGTLAKLEERWEMRVELPSPYTLSFNFVAPAVLRNGSRAVLKLGVPCRESRTELKALQLYGGRGAVRVLAEDAELGALLLEHVAPGLTLAEAAASEEEAMAAFAEVMRKLSVKAPETPSEFPSVENWAAGLARLRQMYGGGTGPLPEAMVSRAEAGFRRLFAEPAGKPLLLHGDLHHYNILSSGQDGWIAIDPKGVIGEAEYGTIPLLLNELPVERTQGLTILRRRIELLAEQLSLNPARIAAWGFSHSVLSAFWCIEGGVGDAELTLERARWFEELQQLF